MKSTVISMIAAAGLMVAGSALAADMPDVAKKNGCTSCHAIGKKVVGPDWAQVSAKYKGDAGAAAHLDGVIQNGSKGVWGSMAMPAQKKVSEADRKELIKFILSL